MSVGHDTQRVTTADNVGISFRVAGLATRIGAAVLDGAILVCLLFVFTVLVIAVTNPGTASGGAGAVETASLVDYLLLASWVLIAILYFTVSQAVSAGRTVGKVALGLRAIRVDGGTASIGEYFLRSVAYVVDVVLGIGVILMFFHPQSRRLGDLLAGTVVVRERTPVTLVTATAPAPVFLRSVDPGPGVDGLGNLSEREFAAVRAFLARVGLRPEQRAELAGRLAALLLDRMELPPAAPERMWPPELFMERLYLQLAPRFDRGGSPLVQVGLPYGPRFWPPPPAPR